MFKIGKWPMIVFVLCVFWGSLPGTSSGQDVVLVNFNTAQDIIPEGWELVVNQGNAHLRLTPEAHGQVLQLRSENASFGLQKEVHLNLQDTPYLVWEWKVTELPSGGDFRTRQTDDQAAQLIVSFSATRFISYIWDSTVAKGVSGKAPSPPFRKIMALVVQSGPQALGSWITERRNVVEDYTRLFGEPPKTLRGLRIQINSQHTHSRAEAYWKSIILTNNQHTASHSPEHRIASQATSLKLNRR